MAEKILLAIAAVMLILTVGFVILCFVKRKNVKADGGKLKKAGRPNFCLPFYYTFVLLCQ